MNIKANGDVLYSGNSKKRLYTLMRKVPLILKKFTYRGHSHWLLGSITVEASLCVPVFFLVTMALFYVFKTMLGINTVQYQMSEAVRNYASYHTKIGSVEMLAADAKILVWDDEKKLCHVEYKEKVPVIGSKLFSIRLYQQLRFSDYSGRSMITPGQNTDMDVYVYVAENGRVYHRNYNCSYLKPSVSGCPVSGIDTKRNNSGAKYYPCESCCKLGISGGVVYITSYGNRYHTDKSCSGIKRNPSKVKLSGVGTMPPCSKCG